ncbi:MAG: tRNA (N(6)-L-threonylcarbamoyladenosine(37)-C(2))-methylthiotransferase MtaB [Desulfuromonas sp.]|nr:MAG: tRNA (N(6)-L-threonylcarbamoyladenosine(37)-C(2))-methylthiotransferase MtaB [Desulfuromonas sp.]
MTEQRQTGISEVVPDRPAAKTVAIATLGCKTNQFESAAIEDQLREAGYRVVPFEEGADLVIVNTCTVTAATDSQSRNLIRRARRINFDSRVIVTGCYAQVDADALRKIPGVALVIGNEEKQDLLRYLSEEREEQLVEIGDIRQRRQAVPLQVSSFAERSRAFVQVQNGCDSFCSYCIIPFARGTSRSVVPQQVVDQVKSLHAAGHPEIVLTGIHLGIYGLDLHPPTNVLELVQRLCSETDVPRLRFGSLEPTEISDDLLTLMTESDRICPHLHIPLQSGSDTVLQRMNRHYRVADFHALVDRIHRLMPDAAIGLDVIAGFPGESDAEHQQTRRLLEELPISHLHVFPFSRRPGTAAAAMPDQLPGDLIKQRAAELRITGEDKNRQFSERFAGQVVEVVVEGANEEGLYRGMSRNYLTVVFPGSEALRGRRTWVRLESWTPGGLRGTLV